MDQPLKTLEKSGRARRISRLDDAAGILAELQRIYREARRGELEPYVAGRLTAILKEARATIETADLERRGRGPRERRGGGERGRHKRAGTAWGKKPSPTQAN